jgi:hypothetical protein
MVKSVDVCLMTTLAGKFWGSRKVVSMEYRPMGGMLGMLMKFTADPYRQSCGGFS